MSPLFSMSIGISVWIFVLLILKEQNHVNSGQSIKTLRLGKTRLWVGEKTMLVLYKHRNNNNNNNKHLLISVKVLIHTFLYSMEWSTGKNTDLNDKAQRKVMEEGTGLKEAEVGLLIERWSGTVTSLWMEKAIFKIRK